MKKKIGIVTNYDRYNFGNRLQNYAVQTILQEMGYKCETLVPEALLQNPFKNKAKNVIKNIICALAADKISVKYTDAVRRYRIDRFNHNIHFRAVKGSENIFPKTLVDEYDYFVTGSDQVWNPYFWEGSLGSNEAGFNNYLLGFARPEQRCCISPSVGMSEIPEEWEEPFRNELCQFPSLNVREREGAELIQRITGKDVDVTLDPTLLLTREEWNKVERKTSACPKEKYILYIMLGSEAAEINDEQKKIINQIAKKRGLTSCRMMIRKRPEWFACGAGEFIHMIKNAELVCTDSFHCTVFSILYEKPFLLFNRIISKYGIDMSSRTNTLLLTLQLERKNSANQIWDEEHIFESNYQDSIKVLERERQRTLKIFKDSFKA